MTKLRWALIGGGEGSQIGPAHRLAAALDGQFELVAGALDVDPDASRRFGQSLGIRPERAYGHWQQLLEGEKGHASPIDLVTVATPNRSHFEITRALLQHGYHVLCEKPMTMTVPEAEEIVRVAAATRRLCAVNFGYSGYAMVRQMRAMVAHGDLGKVRMFKAEFAHGHHAAGDDASNPRVRWRYDPSQAGESAVLADAGVHALHMACFVTGQRVQEVSADFANCVSERQLEDDAMLNLRMTGGTVGRLWCSAIALGRQHGLTLQIFGEEGGLAWAQEQPNQLLWTPLGGRTTILERGEGGLYPAAREASRVTVGHAEGMPLAFANLYKDLALEIRARKQQDSTADETWLPTAADGWHSVSVVHAAAQSAADQGRWVRTALSTK